MKILSTVFILLVLASCKGIPNNSNNVATIKRKGELDSTHVKVILKFDAKLKNDGTILDPSGLEIGKSDTNGIIRNRNGQKIGKREKSLNELRAEYSQPGL